MKKVYLAGDIETELRDFLLSYGYELETMVEGEQTLKNMLPQCVGLIISNRLRVTREIIDSAPKLRWIARLGSGMEIVDTEYAARKEIICISSPDGNSNAVAEHALGLILTLTKNIVRSHGEVLQQQWLREANRGIEIEGRTMGIIGLGHTGFSLAKKLVALGMEVLAYDLAPKNIHLPRLEQVQDLSEIYKRCEFVSFHVPLNNSTHHYFNQSFLEAMERPFYLINTSRGAVVDPAVLIKGLYSGKIKGAGIDVWPEEPPIWVSKTFIKVQHSANIVFTPHIAGYTFEARKKMSLSLLYQLKALLEGGL